MTLVRVWRWASTGIVLLAAVYFLVYARAHVDDLAALQWNARKWTLLGLSSVLWAVVVGLGGIVWQGLLRDLGHPLPLGRGLFIFAVSQFGKYLPGNVAHHVGRVVMAQRAGVPAAITLQTLLIEMAWAVGVAAGLALLGLSTLIGKEGGGGLNGVTLAALVCGALLLPAAMVLALNRLAPRLAAHLSRGVGLRIPGIPMMLIASLLILVGFLLVGLLLELHARFLFGAAGGHMLMLTTVYAWAWIAGYITPGAPAGLGVREAVLVAMLSPVYGPAVAVGLSLSLRIATTVGDGLTFLIGLAARQFLSTPPLSSDGLPPNGKA